jgi:hypothetical protein
MFGKLRRQAVGTSKALRRLTERLIELGESFIIASTTQKRHSELLKKLRSMLRLIGQDVAIASAEQG